MQGVPWWRPTPAENMLRIERYDVVAATWDEVPFPELRQGDIYRAFAGDRQIDPLMPGDTEASDQCAYCEADPARVSPQGYGVKVMVNTLEGLLAYLKRN